MPERTYKQLQEEAELLGIKQNQSAEKLTKAIEEATSPKAVALLNITISKLDKFNAELSDELKETSTKLGEAAEAKKDLPSDLAGVIDRIVECHDTQLEDRNVHTDPYLTGLANGLLIATGIARGETIKERLLTPITQSRIGGAKVITGRQRLIKEAGKFITNAGGGRWLLRTGLTVDQIAEADEIMKRLGVEKGKYSIPAE